MAQYNKNTGKFQSDGKTLFEAVMIADQYGDMIGGANPSGMAIDAFGRARVSTPLTLFDDYHRYQDNKKSNDFTSGTATISHNANTSMIEMSIGTASGDSAMRESTRVFSYQPGKSLQILNTFSLNEPKIGLRQRVGYFGVDNGIFFQTNDLDVSFVKRSKGTGTVANVVVNQSDWNLDRLDGTGPSGITLDPTKAQILFIDVEWLGVGSVRCGFIFDGKPIHCHSFHHANIETTTYMTTGSLPSRVEITNTGITATPSILRKACTSVISEGGYELRGYPRCAATPITTPKDLPSAGTFVPLISIRLLSSRLDAIVIPKAMSILAIGNNSRIRYKLTTGSSLALTGASWVSGGSGSNVEYDISATAMTGGIDIFSGYTASTTQSVSAVTLVDGLFKYQLERNTFTNQPFIFTIAAASSTAGDDILASIDWEEL